MSFLVLLTCGNGGGNIFQQLSVVPLKGMSVKANTSMIVGGSETLYPIYDPGNATDRDVSWSSDDESVATVGSDGKVTGVSAGSTDIRVVTVDGRFPAVCAVTVSEKPIAVTGISLDVSNLSLIRSQTRYLIATIVPSTATNQNVKWTSTDATVATVSSSGRVTALNGGTTTIKAETVDGGFSATCNLTVSQTAVSLNYDGNSYTTDILPPPYNGTQGDVITVTSDPTPDSGYLFCGWNTASNGSGTSYSSSQVFNIIANTTLYAQWVGCSGTTITSVPPGVTNVVIPEGVTTIATSAFQGNTTIVSVSIPSSVTSIGVQAFMNCSNLTTITSVNSRYQMVGGGLVDTNSNTLICVPAQYPGEFVIDSSITSIYPYSFSDCSQITIISFETPVGMTQLPGNAFSGLTAAAQIILPEGMTSVADYAFYNCGASRIDFPASMNTIGTSTASGAFGSNANLASIYFNATSPITTFNGPSTGPLILNSAMVTAYVPSAVLLAYQSSVWVTIYGLTVNPQ